MVAERAGLTINNYLLQVQPAESPKAESVGPIRIRALGAQMPRPCGPKTSYPGPPNIQALGLEGSGPGLPNAHALRLQSVQALGPLRLRPGKGQVQGPCHGAHIRKGFGDSAPRNIFTQVMVLKKDKRKPRVPVCFRY